MTSKFALVIANTDYQDESLAKLTAPSKDAEEFARILKSPDICAFDDIKIFLNQPDFVVRVAIDEFFEERKPDDLLVLYFSGHGIRDEFGALYLAVKNTNRFHLRSTAIKSDFIREAMDQSRSKRQMLILDCCNSGAFTHGTKTITGGSMGTALLFEAGYGRVILTASDSTQFAWEGDKVIGDETTNSLFTHFLVKGLEGEADSNGDGKITVDELYDYAYEKVKLATSKQTPSKFSDKQQGDIILRENMKPRDVKPAPLSVDTLDLLASTSSRSRDLGIQDLAKLLAGNHLGLTRAAEDKLREIAANDDSFNLRKTASDILANHGFSVVLPSSSDDNGRDEGKPRVEPKQEKPPPRVEKKKPVVQTASIEVEDSKPAKPKFPVWAIRLSTVLIISLLLWGIYKVRSDLFVLSPTPTNAPPTNPIAGSTWIQTIDGMTLVFVPEGKFAMGSDTSGQLDEQPIHQIDLDAFWIDQTEVTNKMYTKCVNNGVCKQPAMKTSFTRDSYYGNSEFDIYPVIRVDWNMAKSYCEWAGRELPTEAQWEKAARGADGRTYPWGNESPNSSLLNYIGSNVGDTTEVGKYPGGKSVYGAYDMAGNVREWINDWYSDTYYQSSPASNPIGPDSGDYRVLRGGSWNLDGNYARSTSRLWNDPMHIYDTVGFRCSRSP